MNTASPLRIIFMGTPEFAVPALNRLYNSPHSVITVVTIPDKIQGRGRKVRPSEIKTAAEALSLPLIQPEDIKTPEFTLQIRDLAPDLIVVVAFQILPESIFKLPRYGAFNLHASLLPRYRGAAPIHWALLNGDKETGVTTFFLKRRVDTGNIILQKKTAINIEDNLQSLYEKLRLLGAELVLETVDQIASHSVFEYSQDNALATPAPKVNTDTQQLNFRQSAEQCRNRVRAFAPKPGAFTYRNGTRLKIINTMVSNAEGSPGTVVAISDHSITVACGSGALVITRLQPESKNAMNADAYLRGNPLQVGDQFG